MQIEIAFIVDFIGVLTMCFIYIEVATTTAIPCEGNVLKYIQPIRKPIARARSIRDRS